MNKQSIKLPGNLVLGLVIFCIGVIYFAYLPVNYDFDGTVFSQYLRNALIRDDLVRTSQPQHPLYTPVNYLIYKGLKMAVEYNVLEYFHLQLFSLCFGLLTLWVSYKIIMKVTDQPFFHFAGMILIASCYGIWYYSVEAEVHMAGLFFITLGVYLLFFKPGPSDTLYRILAASFCFAAAAGFHLANGLITFAVLFIFIIERKSFAKIFRFFSFYFLFLLVELLGFVLITKVDMWDHYKNVLWGKDIMAGYEITYWTGFSPEALWESIKSAAHGILIPATPLLTILSILLFFASAALVTYAGVRSKDKKTYYKLGLWLLPYFIFFTFWDHRNIEFKLNVILPFLLLFILSAAFIQIENRIKIFLFTAIIAVVFFVNVYFFVLPANDIQNNLHYQVAKAVGKETPPRSIIVIGGCGSDLSLFNKIYISYFAYRRTFILDWMLGKGLSLEEIHTRLKQKRLKGTPVYFFSEIVQKGKTVRQLLKNHNLEAVDYFEFIKKMELKEKIPLIKDYYLARI